MDQELVKVVASQGVFAMLFIYLLFYVLKHNEKREERLMAWLGEITQHIGSLTHNIEEIRDDVDYLKERVSKD